MAFAKGNKLGGRKVGSKNKLKKAQELFESLGMSPLEEAVKELNKLTDPKDRFDCFMELVRYVHPVPKDKQEIEMTGLDQLVIVRKPKEEKKDEA